ncbi:hypothetical protein IFR05_015162 [Cadophora sp. M221]|nr:hypothetical protein IFR05_015162 [Cadophora sp. M221]
MAAKIFEGIPRQHWHCIWPRLFTARRIFNPFSREVENLPFIKYLATIFEEADEDEGDEDEGDEDEIEDEDDVPSDEEEDEGDEDEGDEDEIEDEDDVPSDEEEDEDAESCNEQSNVRRFMIGIVGEDDNLLSRDQVDLVASFCEKSKAETNEREKREHVALLDERCMDGTMTDKRGFYRPYPGPLTCQELRERLSRKRFRADSEKDLATHALEDEQHDAARRIVFITNLDSFAIEALVTTVARSQAPALQNLFYKHLTSTASIGVTIKSFGFQTFTLDFHISYYVLRESKKSWKDTRRKSNGKPLRQFWELPFLSMPTNNKPASTDERYYLYEAVTSVGVTGSDHWTWAVYGFVDTYWDSRESVDGYHEMKGRSRGRADPLANGQINADEPLWDPRKYFLKVVEIRTGLVLMEWSQIINKMEREVQQSRTKLLFELSPNDPKPKQDVTNLIRWNIYMTNILRLLGMKLSDTVAAWDSFRENEIYYFNDYLVIPIETAFGKLKAHLQKLRALEKELRKDNPNGLNVHLGLESIQGRWDASEELELLVLENDHGSYTGTQDEHTLVGTQDEHTLVATQDSHTFESKQSSSLNVPDSDTFEDDCMSVESNEEDIASQVATRRTEPEILAVKLFGSFFGELEELRPLHKEALEKLGAKRFQENYRRILKLYVLKLRNEAQTALEKDTVRVLKSRPNRLSIAQRIVALMQEDGDDNSKPFDELASQSVEKQDLEDWARNAYVLPGGDTIEPIEEEYEHSRGGSNGEDGEYNDENEDENRLEELHFLNITQANRFLHKGVPFQMLALELRLLVLPASLREVIEFTPKCSIRVSPVNITSFMNKAKGFIEDYTAFDWDWWPLMPRVPDLPLGRWRLQWKFCGQNLYKEISAEEANSIEQTLGLIGDHPSKCFCCGTEVHRMDWTTIFHRTCQSIANKLNWEALSSSLFGQTPPSTAQQRYTPLTAATSSPSSNSAHSSTQTTPPISSRSNSGSFPQAHGGGSGTMSTAPQEPSLWIVFGIKNMREFDEIENIEISSLVNDSSFFKELRTRYDKHCWLFQRWFSPFRFRHCNFVRFEMIDVEQVYSSGEALPDDYGYTSHYEYDPRPPRAKNPLIDRKLFSICLKACDNGVQALACGARSATPGDS